MKTKEEIIEYVYDMNLQNLTEKTSFDRAYKQGIEDTIDDLIELNLLTIACVSDLLPIGTTVTIENDKSEWGSKAGKELKITGYCAWKDDPKGGYEVDGEGIYLREDFIGL